MFAFCQESEELEGDGGAGFGVGEGVVVVFHVVAAGGCGEVELVAGQAQAAARGGKRAVEFITGIFHVVFGKYRFQTALVKGAVVGHERQPFDAGRYLIPDFGKQGLVVGVFARKSVNARCPVIIIIRRRLDETVIPADYLSSAHNHYTHAADAGALAIGCLKIYSCEILHILLYLLSLCPFPGKPFQNVSVLQRQN